MQGESSDENSAISDDVSLSNEAESDDQDSDRNDRISQSTSETAGEESSSSASDLAGEYHVAIQLEHS